MASLDARHYTAAMEQLAVLGRVNVQTLPIVEGDGADRRPRDPGREKLGGYDVVLLDTAGRTTLDRSDDDRGRRCEAGRRPA